jgi:hypothetical protein
MGQEVTRACGGAAVAQLPRSAARQRPLLPRRVVMQADPSRTGKGAGPRRTDSGLGPSHAAERSRGSGRVAGRCRRIRGGPCTHSRDLAGRAASGFAGLRPDPVMPEAAGAGSAAPPCPSSAAAPRGAPFCPPPGLRAHSAAAKGPLAALFRVQPDFDWSAAAQSPRATGS